jgi:hypothetical protein
MNEETKKEVNGYLDIIGEAVAEIDYLDNEGVQFTDEAKERIKKTSTHFLMLAQTINKGSF